MMYLFGPAVCNWILCETEQNLFYFSFFFPLFSTQKRIIFDEKETTRNFLSSFWKVIIVEKKKLKEKNNRVILERK